jgi:hypothetical protein
MNESLIINNGRKRQLFYLITFSICTVTLVLYLSISKQHNLPFYRDNFELAVNVANDEILDFEGFDNINGVNLPIVPNIVHLLFLQETKIKFYQMINIFSIYLNHKPNYIYLHCDNCTFSGKYYEKLRNYKKLWEIVKIKQIPYKETIFGVKYGWINHHRSDIWRLLILMNYGGIYLDNDVYIVNSLNKYLKYEMTVSWDSDKDGLGVQVLIAHRNARLLKSHYDSYR